LTGKLIPDFRKLVTRIGFAESVRRQFAQTPDVASLHFREGLRESCHSSDMIGRIIFTNCFILIPVLGSLFRPTAKDVSTISGELQLSHVSNGR